MHPDVALTGATSATIDRCAPLCSRCVTLLAMPLTPDTAAIAATPHLSWELEPAIVMPLLAIGAMYLIGTTRLWRRAGRGHGVAFAQAAAFSAGWLTLTLALVSPLHPLGEHLFAAHMAQHVVLMTVAAPLLVLGRPIVAIIWALPPAWRRGAGALSRLQSVSRAWWLLSLPLVASVLQAVVMWVWHVPRWYDAAVINNALHALEHACFVGSAMLFWWAMLRLARSRAGSGRAVVYVVAAGAQSGALGVLLTFARAPMYPVYRDTAAWGFTPLQDQQLAGLIMWIPAGVIYLVAALCFANRWLQFHGDRQAAAFSRPDLPSQVEIPH
ncbi:MAG: cytochrome c oxidase assembly protein [Gemmatimonadales bacterium]